MNYLNTIVNSVRLFFHPATPWYVKAILAVAGIYLISPVDLIPDWIVGLGLLDDITIVPMLVGLALWLLRKGTMERAF